MYYKRRLKARKETNKLQIKDANQREIDFIECKFVFAENQNLFN